MRYEVTRQGADEGARDAERDGGQQLSPLREAELSLRDRGGATCTDGPQLFEGEPNQVLDPSTGDGGTGSPSDAALSRGTRPPGGARGGRPHRAGEQPFTPLKSEESDPFSASEALYLGVVGFLSGEEAKGLTHSELEARLDVEGRELLRQLFQDLTAPRGALTYPPWSGEGMEVTSLGPMAYLDSKDEGNNSMPLNRLSCPGVWDEGPGGGGPA